MTISDIDLHNIKELFQEILRETLNLEPGQTLDDKLDERIGHLPTKEEFYAKEDEVLIELKTVREEMQILNGLHTKVNNHDERIESLEKFTKIKTL